MKIDPTSEKPIFLQIADELEDAIFTGVFEEETQIPSTNEIATLWKINPHTVLKGMNILVDEDMIYKKRGLGMFVKQGAVQKITEKRQNNFYDMYIESLVLEAKKLDITFEEVMKLIERGYGNANDQS
ncbi:GntR family transcriptional regulator [[Eubacterium] hominis]|uniref:GntR family transcriptional regulator n=1 Tax=[Eubacterium] hominis TaxID=2764325 RepID=UPI003A4DA7EB